ncbi:hypothetical protein JOH48_007833 [Bradyrhizobium elkanii]|nr:hypothetical protein [Bradyrhizobium elkanii]
MRRDLLELEGAAEATVDSFGHPLSGATEYVTRSWR